MPKDKKRTIDTIKGKALLAFTTLCFSVTLTMTAPRTVDAQAFCEWPVQAYTAARITRGANKYWINFLLMPSGSVPSLPALMRVLTVEAIQKVTGGEIIEPINLPGLSAISDVPYLGVVLGIVGGILNIPEPINILKDGATYRFGGTEYMDEQMRGRLYGFWAKELHPALKKMSAQLSASDINTSRILASINDMEGLSSGSAIQQRKELEAKKKYMVSDEACQFDTTATALAATRKISRGVTKAYAQQMSNIGNNMPGTAGATGTDSFYQARMGNYQSSLCDTHANRGDVPCEIDGTQPSGGVMPSRTLFGRETIDLTDKDVRNAVEELTYNITGFKPPPPIPPAYLTSTKGKEQRQGNRIYLAQMDAITSMISGIVGERAPGAPAPDIAQMRQAAGVSPGDVSQNPSEREIMQAVADQASSPSTYTNMGDNPELISKTEAYQSAYNLMLLYRLIEKQERISTAYAIETANMMRGRYRTDGFKELAPK